MYSENREDNAPFADYDECLAVFKDTVAKVKDVWVTLPDKAGDPFELASGRKFADMHMTLQYSEPNMRGDGSTSKQFIGDGFTSKQFIHRFMQDGRLNGDRVFRAFDMYADPAACPADKFNLWTPFAVETIEVDGADSVQRIDDLVFLLRHHFILSGRKQVTRGCHDPPPPHHMC